MVVNMIKSKPSTREQIMLAAEHLFAHKGIDAVSLNEINKAAGQKNTSSLHYHFGSKEELIQEIVYFHYEEIETALQDSLNQLELTSALRYRQLIECTIAPFVAKLNTERGINYLLIVNQLLIKSADMLIEGHPAQVDKARLRLFDIFARLANDMPDEIKITRMVMFSGLMFQSLASFAQFEKQGGYNPLGTKTFFIEQLAILLTAMISADF